MKRILLCCLLNIAFYQSQASEFVMTPGYRMAYMEVLRLKFDHATLLMNQEKQNNPANLPYAFLQNYIDFLKVIISEEKNDLITYVNNNPSRLKLILTVDRTSPWHLYTQAQMNLQSGIIFTKSGDYLKAAINIRKAYQQFVENDRLFPDFLPNKAGLGLLHVLIGSIPESHKWIPNMFSMEGNVKIGLKELHTILSHHELDESFPYLHNECLFITAFVTYNLAVNESNTLFFLNIIKDEHIEREITKNPLLIYAIASFYSNQGMNDKALSLLINRPSDNSYYKFHYLDYLTGVTKLNKLDQDARIYFHRYITNFKGHNFIKAAYQRIAWSYLIENNFIEYRKYISRIRLFGSDLMEADKEAMVEHQSNRKPHTELLKARLLFDGGYYDRASKILQTTKTAALTKQQSVEHTYRQARIHHKLGNLPEAKVLYHNTFKKGYDMSEYYAANSLLNLGNIYEKEGNLKQAMVCYKECLQLDFTEYRKSIQQKAKSGINRLTRR